MEHIKGPDFPTGGIVEGKEGIIDAFTKGRGKVIVRATTNFVKEKGWFTRGVKLLITGYRRDDTFVSKKYKTTGGHQLYLISKIEGKNIQIKSTRYGQE